MRTALISVVPSARLPIIHTNGKLNMNIGYRILGSGPIKVIACHGWFGSSSDWSAMEPAIDTDRFTFAWMDQRGYGLSADRSGKFSVDEVAQDAIDLAEHLEWKTFHLLGHSMGGKVVQRILQRATDRVTSVVAVTPVPASGVPFDDETYGIFQNAADSDDVRQALVSYSVSDRHSQAWIQHLVRDSRQNSRADAFAAYLPSWARDDFSADVHGIQTPILVLVGEHDPALRPELMQATFLRSYPNAELDVICNAGHYPMWETPVDLASRVQRYMLKVSGQASAGP